MWYALNSLSLEDIMKKSEGCTEKENATNVAWHGYVELAIDLPGFVIFSPGNSWITFSKILIKTKSTFPSICTVVAFLQKALCSRAKQVQFSDNYGQMFQLQLGNLKFLWKVGPFCMQNCPTDCRTITILDSCPLNTNSTCNYCDNPKLLPPPPSFQVLWVIEWYLRRIKTEC